MKAMNKTSFSVQEIREKLANNNGKEYWQGLEELADTEEFQEFLHQEFPRQAAPLVGSFERRDFLKLLGASLALAGLGACAQPVSPREKIMPYVRTPEEIIPGRPLFFATAITHGGYAEGLLVESHEGRPTKVEGNPDHPASLGATDATTQATVLSLYDPDRSQVITERGQGRSWQDFTTAIATALQGPERGRGLRILTETITSPTLAKQLSDLLERYPEAVWHQYEPLHQDAALEGARLAFGEEIQPSFDLGKADVILSLDGDLLGSGPGKLRYARQFAQRRRVREAGDDMNRLYVLESTPTPTGSLADHRLAAGPAAVAHFAGAVAGRLGLEVPEAGTPDELSGAFLEAVVADLEAHHGSSLVVAGEGQPAVVHALAHAINAKLDNIGTTVTLLEPVEAKPVDHRRSLAELTTAMAAGEVTVLVMLGGNPAYTVPADLDFEAALGKVPLSVHLSPYLDETSSRATWHLPQTHHLESWGDARAFDGTITIMQPLIAPLFGGKSEYEVLAALLGEADKSGYDVIRDYWRERVGGDFDAFWRATVYRGTVPDSAAPSREVSLQAFPVELPDKSNLTLSFRPDPGIGDGRWANNGWLQELPKPFSKLTWDNAALISPATAEELGVRNNDVVTLGV